ncbi:hypothetical protein [Kribbella solani]|uniref:hypothetical protein n=1 Tax=Kribbella solani TaxID=236067 RepID=UPI0029A7C297|nr:hypothetical protein [Kribbella solani]MDX2970562.1 hypothetical protein [Kribbella solani]
MSPQWETVTSERRVLAVARTVTSLNRLLEVLVVFGDDPRVGVEFVVSSGSRFGAEVPAVLRRLGARIVDWDDAVATTYDLILSASEHDDLHELQGPLVLLPHGAGFQKHSPHNVAGTRERAGLTTRALWHDDRRVPSLVVVSHRNQRRLLPEFADRILVAGDPAMDALIQLAGHREELRRQFGLQPGQRLVTVTSTWGPRSLLGRWPTLPPQLLAELPLDEFRVAAVLHPNVWAEHGGWQIRNWLRTALASGLILVPPTGPWQSALAAAECVIGDHGSLSAYATGLGTPLILGAFGAEEVPRDTAMWQLGRTAPRLDGHLSLADQIRAALSSVDINRGLAAEVFEREGQSLDILQREFFEMLGLAPVHRPRAAVPEVWDARPPNIRAFQVEVADDGSALRVERFPAELDEFARPGAARRLVAYGNAEEAILQRAAAIVAPDATDGSWASATLDRYPGCRLVVAPKNPTSAALTARHGRTAYSMTYRGIDGVVAAAIWLYLRAEGFERTEVTATVGDAAGSVEVTSH